jgi:hypothetical protein
LYSGGGGNQNLSDLPNMAELEPKVTVERVVDPWVPEADGAPPAEGALRSD